MLSVSEGVFKNLTANPSSVVPSNQFRPVRGAGVVDPQLETGLGGPNSFCKSPAVQNLFANDSVPRIDRMVTPPTLVIIFLAGINIKGFVEECHLLNLCQFSTVPECGLVSGSWSSVK